MATQWKKTKYPGVRYYEHATRKHGIRKDSYYAIRYQKEGKRKEEGLGWASKGWTAEKANAELSELKKAYTTGNGATSLAEKRDLEKERREKGQIEKERVEKESVSFDTFFTDTYFPIAKRTKKAGSYKREKQNFDNWIKPVIGKMPFSQIAPFHIEKIKKNMLDAETKRTPRTIQYCFATVRQVWNMAKRDGLTGVDSPTKFVKIPRIDNKRMRFLTHEQANLLMKDLSSRSKQLHDMALLSLHCGLRAGEIFHLTWDDIDIGREMLSLRDTKSVKTRTAYMTDAVKRMFLSMKCLKNDTLVFADRNGNKIQRISHSFQRAIDDLGLNKNIVDQRKKVVFHTLRHTFASWLVENGTDLYTVKELLGHSSIAMTERYSHLGANTLQSAVKSLEKKMAELKERNADNIINLNS